MKLIRNFEINSSSLPASGAVRNFKVEGDDGAVFSLQVKTSAGRTYNFSTKVFDTTENFGGNGGFFVEDGRGVPRFIIQQGG